jgi:hypothetical protein
MKKKLFTLLLAVAASVGNLYASKYVVPSDAVLADYYNQGDVCVCIFVPADMDCNDIVFTGSYNGWKSTAAECITFEQVEGYAGWYVCSFEPEAEPDPEKGMQGKPVLLDVDGNFNWAYQVGAATTIRGGVQVVQGAYAGEIDLINYGADAPNVLTVDAWMHNPCTFIYHNYTITVINDSCNNLAVPFIVGGMNGWNFQQMQLDQAKTLEYQVPVYTTTFKAAESTPYQILSGLMDTTGQIIEAPSWNDIARMQKLVDDVWARIPGEEGDNQLTHEDANIVWDLRDSTLRWARCEERYPVKLQVKLPALGCPEAVEIIGTFDDWSGTAMELLESGWFFVELEAKASQYFKFRSAGSWDHDIEIYRVANDEWTRVLDNELNFGQLWHDSIYNGMSCKRIEIDMSDPTYYRWGGKYNLNVICDNNKGRVTGNGQYNLGPVLIDATPNYGYHFAQWSDGNTDNPRVIELTQDTTFTAEFAKNKYTISTQSANQTWGTTAGDTTAQYLDEVEISAIPNHGYHFVRWNDYITSNPRTVSVTGNKTYTATFAKNVYSITKNAEHGSISGNNSAEYLDFVTLTVTPDYGYHFTQWSDGLKDNPRIFQITSDTTFTAEFAYDRVGTCGKDLALVWSYDPNSKVLTIGNAGSFTENMQFGAEAPNEMEELVIGNSVTAIGANAFAGIETLKKITFGESVKTIGEQAFYNCVNLETIFNYRPTPTNTYSNAFDGVDKFECTLYVLPSSIDMYKVAAVWRDFYYTYAIGAEETTVTTNDVTVEPQDNAATLTWPTSENAASYTIQITKDGVLFCTLIFNANGQLTGIAFAPSRDGSHHAPSALMTTNGLQFTVTGLNSNTQYGYSVTAKDSNDQPVATYSGKFTTTGEGTATGFEDVQGNNVQCTKVLIDGTIFILRGEKVYNAQGALVK